MLPSQKSSSDPTLEDGQVHISSVVNYDYVNSYDRDHGHIPYDKSRLPPRSRMVLHMQLRGFRQKEIAEALGIGLNHVSRICRSRRYIAEFDSKLEDLDDEFLRLKPQAFRALSNGLCSRDEGTGLRAAETWFRLNGYRGFGPQNNTTGVTINVMAEDVAIKLFAEAEKRRGSDSSQGQGTNT